MKPTVWLCLVLMLACGCGRSNTNKPATGESSVATDLSNQVPLAETDSLVVPKGLDEQPLIGPLADAYRRMDPKNDGWDTEAFGAAAMEQLNSLARQFTADAGSLSDLMSEDFGAPDLWGQNKLAETFRDDCVTVSRIEAPLATAAGESGPSRMQTLITQLRIEFPDRPKVKFKLFRVEANDADVETMVYFHADGKSKTGRKEISATWKVDWELEKSHQPKIRNIQVEQLEVVETNNDGNPLFADCTASILSGDPAYETQLLFSTDHWRTRLCRDYGLDVVANHGLAIGDVNGDMLEDVYVCQQGGLPNRLFLQQPDGTLKAATATSNVDWLNYTASALLVDLDNDGDKDLVVGHELTIVIMHNDGNGKFELATAVSSRSQTFSLSAVDFDLDGDLDIYCCGYNRQSSSVRSGAMGEPLPYHDAQNGGPNTLLRNDGEWQFVDATAEVGLEQNNNRFSFAASWEDYDNDGDPDLYVANDYGRNNLYRNEDGRFTDVAADLNVEDMSAGMSVSWADVNRDGWMDFHVSNMFSAAGNRITYQRQFKDSTASDIRQQYQRHARGNSLFQADGNGGFRDTSETAGITMGRWAWGSKFCDINNDGWKDIVVNNGFITTEDTRDL